MATTGVFIRSKRNDAGFKLECIKKLSALSSVDNIPYITREDTYDGFKVYIKDAATVPDILKVKNLRIAGECFPIYPLATSLIVHARPSDLDEEFEKALRSAMKNVGPVLEIKKIPFHKDFPNIYSGDWKIVLGVPEIEDLEVFTLCGLPDKMFLKLSGRDARYQVKFSCSSCGEDGHTAQRCPGSDVPLSGSETQSRQIDSLSSSALGTSNKQADSKASSNFRIRDRTERDSILDLRRSEFPISLKNIATVAGMIGQEVVREHVSVSNEPIEQDRKAKRSLNQLLNMQNENNERPAKRFKGPVKREESYLNDEISRFYNTSEPSCSTVKDDTIFVEEKNSTASAPSTRIKLPGSMLASRSSSQDESGQVTTSNLAEGTNETIKSELPSTDDNDSDSNDTPVQDETARPIQRRRRPTQFRQIIVPEGIKEIIRKNQAVLDEKQLEAFFNHVKKKACPSEVAKMYTSDVPGLKKQLHCIEDQYYMTPVIHNPDEKYFMKWLRSVLGRFDRTPAKRSKKNS